MDFRSNSELQRLRNLDNKPFVLLWGRDAMVAGIESYHGLS